LFRLSHWRRYACVFFRRFFRRENPCLRIALFQQTPDEETSMAHQRPPTEKEKQQNMQPQAPQESHGGNNAPDAPHPTGERGNGGQRRQARARVRS
jgi:hypothetical protein